MEEYVHGESVIYDCIYYDSNDPGPIDRHHCANYRYNEILSIIEDRCEIRLDPTRCYRRRVIGSWMASKHGERSHRDC